MPTDKSGIYYRLLTINDKNDVIKSIANNFCIRDPLCKSLILSEKDRYEYATYAAMFLTDNKSLGAFDDDNDDQLCGVQINSSSYFVPDIDLEKYLQSVSQKTQNLIRFDHFLQKEMMNKFCGNNYIGGYWISVNAGYSGRGVGHQLVIRCMKWLTTNFRDFDSLVAVTTAPESKHITEKIGFKSTYEMKMSEYKDEKTGERIFANAGVPFVYLMVKLRNVTKSNL